VCVLCMWSHRHVRDKSSDSETNPCLCNMLYLHSIATFLRNVTVNGVWTGNGIYVTVRNVIQIIITVSQIHILQALSRLCLHRSCDNGFQWYNPELSLCLIYRNSCLTGRLIHCRLVLLMTS
jgi:hypothetical protein